jgi:primase-polymerase (primpol)-like protein
MGKVPQQTPAPQAIPPEPTYLPVSPDTIPAELKAHRQWVAWAPKYKLSNKKKPWTKILKNPATGKNAMSNKPHTWGSFKDAMRCYKQRGFAGVGFVPTANDLYCGIDLDNCRDPLTGEIAPWAQEMIDRFASYTEVSPSGTGIRIWIKGKLPPGARNKDQKRGIEVYDEGQYLTITGCHLADTPLTIEPRQQELQAWHMEVFGKPTPAPERPSVVVADMNGQPPAMTDDDVIKLSRESKKSGAKFKRLWVGDISGYASMSEATQGLVNLLA